MTLPIQLRFTKLVKLNELIRIKMFHETKPKNSIEKNF